MRRFLLAPDSFKGTLTAAEVCALEREVILSHIPDAQIRTVPMADGGEGLTDALLALRGGTRMEVTVTGPLGESVTGFYGVLSDGTAVIEMAAAAGLPLAGDRRDPMTATTRGVGELLRHAEGQGCRRVLLGLGGSATNDGGVGMAWALGFRFLDEKGAEVAPLARSLGQIAQIVPPKQPLALSVSAACDVNHPLCGPMGASYIFAPQKGARPEELPLLDEGLSVLARVLERDMGRAVAHIPGAGAAGGLGAAVLGFLGGTLRSGVELVLDAAQFDTLLEETDLVITGEGRLDGQSVGGKVPVGVARRCRARGVPCLALCGCLGPGAALTYAHGITAAFGAAQAFRTAEELPGTCRDDLRTLTDGVIRTLLLLGGRQNSFQFQG